MNSEQQKIEALLFYRNEPVSITWLSRYLGISKNNTKEEVEGMLSFYENRGIEIIITDDEVSLVTSRAFSELINTIEEQEEEKELSKQALETLSIILYKNEVTKPEIDFIRGVNSVYILRNLMIRGLVDKKVNSKDRRSPLYVPTIDLLSFLGINRIEELKNYDEFKKKLEALHTEYLSEQDDTNETSN